MTFDFVRILCFDAWILSLGAEGVTSEYVNVFMIVLR